MVPCQEFCHGWKGPDKIGDTVGVSANQCYSGTVISKPWAGKHESARAVVDRNRSTSLGHELIPIAVTQ